MIWCCGRYVILYVQKCLWEFKFANLRVRVRLWEEMFAILVAGKTPLFKEKKRCHSLTLIIEQDNYNVMFINI